jgi:hypothetical protein
MSDKVGFAEERRKHSQLYRHLTKPLPNLDILHEVYLKTIRPIAFDVGGGLSRMIRERHLVDVVATDVDLGYSPLIDITNRKTATERFREDLEG